MNNLITPDELVVSFKRNGYQKLALTTPYNLQYSVFGVLKEEWTAFQNIQEVAKQFKMVEFLSGSLNLYLFNNLSYQKLVEASGSVVGFQVPTTIFVAYQTARRWLPEITPSGVQQEILFPDVTDKTHAWEFVSELPGVSGKFISNSGGAKPIQKLRWKFSQKSWKTLKADPTGFQCNLDADGNLSDTGQPYFPLNNAVVKVAFDLGDDAIVAGNLEMYGSQRIVLRFKGRRQ